MRFALAAGAIVVVALIAGASALFLIPERQLTNEVYARICADITRQQLTQPASLDIIEAVVSAPTDLDQARVVSEISPTIRKYPGLYGVLVDKIGRDYKNQTPHREVRAFIRHSGSIRVGLPGVGLSECVFREKPEMSGYIGSIVDVILNGREITPGDAVDWTLMKAGNLSLSKEVEIGLGDRIRYLTGRITTG